MDNIERIEVLKQDTITAPLTGQVWFWHWLAANNKIIATSGEPFFSKSDAYDAAERIVSRLENKNLPIRIIE
jgi:hypothetical protein